MDFNARGHGKADYNMDLENFDYYDDEEEVFLFNSLNNLSN